MQRFFTVKILPGDNMENFLGVELADPNRECRAHHGQQGYETEGGYVNGMVNLACTLTESHPTISNLIEAYFLPTIQFKARVLHKYITSLQPCLFPKRHVIKPIEMRQVLLYAKHVFVRTRIAIRQKQCTIQKNTENGPPGLFSACASCQGMRHVSTNTHATAPT